MITIDKKQICLIIAGVLLIVGLIAWYVLSGNVHSDGTAATNITQQLDQVLTNQRNLTTQLDGYAKDVAASNARLETVTNRLETVSGRISNAENGVSQATEKLRSSDALIEELRRINSENERTIREILQRGQTGTN